MLYCLNKHAKLHPEYETLIRSDCEGILVLEFVVKKTLYGIEARQRFCCKKLIYGIEARQRECLSGELILKDAGNHISRHGIDATVDSLYKQLAHEGFVTPLWNTVRLQ